MAVLLGAIADDFTGATDLANTLVTQGMRVTQVIGVPDADTRIGDAQAVIVALKSRTLPADEAISSSLAALEWLRDAGAMQIIFKYCSTFDSTREGNIGPVCDALMDALDCDFALVCPAFPTNGRTVYKGLLFVGDELLSESSMRDHPLTPMRDANLMRLMDAQSHKRSGLIPLQVVRQGVAAIEAAVDALRARGVSYGVVDAIGDTDLLAIGHAAAGHALITGGSGIARGLPDNFRAKDILHYTDRPAMPSLPGRQLVLAGSCSQATREQIEWVAKTWPIRKIDVHAIAAGENVVAPLIEWACEQDSSRSLLVYASSDPAEVTRVQQRYGAGRAGAMIEAAMGELARRLVYKGFRRLVVAGGETAGAVVSALNVKALRIGPQIDPGVPWTESLSGPSLALALKSGNFGSPDFFPRAFEVLG